MARLFRTVLRDCVEEQAAAEDPPSDAQGLNFEKQHRSKSLSFDHFRSRFLAVPLFMGGALGGSRGNLEQSLEWTDEEEEPMEDIGRRNRSRSLPEISPVEQSAHG